MAKTEGNQFPSPRPDLNPEQFVLVRNVAQSAENVLNNRNVEEIDFTEPLGDGSQAAYSYRWNGDRRLASLTVTGLQDQMRIVFNGQESTTTLKYSEQVFGSYLETTLTKDPSGEWVVLQRYTNDPQALDGLLIRATHHLGFANPRLSK